LLVRYDHNTKIESFKGSSLFTSSLIQVHRHRYQCCSIAVWFGTRWTYQRVPNDAVIRRETMKGYHTDKESERVRHCQ